MNYTLGLDIGITSVGSCAIDNDNTKLIELAVRRFDEAKEAKEARLNRSARRTLRRKQWRKEQLLDAFNDFEIISKTEIEKYGKTNYLSFYGKGEGLDTPNVYTVYHLRKKAISEKVSKREILLALYNILQARGHFLLDTIDFSRDGINFEIFKEKFYSLTEKYVTYVNDRKEFETKVLKKVFEDTIGLKDLKTVLNNERFTVDESDNALIAITNIVKGGKIKIGFLYDDEDENSLNVSDLKKKDELNELQAALVELYDICRISRILKDGKQYICDVAVENIDKFEEIKRGTIQDSEKLKEWQNASKSRMHSYKNLNNSYPNGLYVKEINAILHNQQKYYPEISDEFIEVCKTIASARIPYYIGPLGDNAKNRWTDKKGQIKYSYDYSLKKGLINEFESIKKWKENMVSRCTYLPDEIALPKGSLLGEIFSILNELNNFNCKDENNDDYYLTREDKIKTIDELFLKKEMVTLEDVKELLDLGDYYSVKGNTKKFNNKITLYRQIANICEELKLNSIIDVFKEKEKIKEIEDMILDINLFDEGKLKKEYFTNKYGEEKASKLSLLKSNGFYSFSKEFIFNTIMNEDGETMLDILFDDNSSEYRNNQQVIISSACDKEGNKINFLENKYEKIIRENDNKLSIDLILSDGKPTIPVSRAVIRALNETFKVYNAYIDVYGVPSRVVVETASGKDSIKDFTEQNGSPMKHYKKMGKLADYLFGQIKEKDKNNAILGGKIEEWNELQDYYSKYKDKIELYIRQDGIDLLTGKKIALTNLDEYEIDHILPRGFGDDSQDDKMLTSKLANGKKGDRLPIEFLESSDAIEFTTMTVGRFTGIVNKLAEMKMISDKKQERLLLRSQEEAAGFVNQNLVDTRYVISQFISMLNAFNRVNGYNTHIACLNSSFTKIYATALRIKKNRDFGDQHHALDAACLCIADRCLNEYFPNYDSQKSAYSKKGNYAGYGKYSEFVEELRKLKVDENEDSRSRLNNFIRYAFRKAYGQDISRNGIEAPIIQAIKNKRPLLSWKVEKNYDGKLFDATLYKPKSSSDESVLTMLGVNNDKRSFSSIYIVAVDIYKINKKNYAIHVPYAIIDDKGNIDKDKYIKLIKEYYNADVLLNENGNDINGNAFRFRLFLNDIFYDTEANECHLFNKGSMEDKRLRVNSLNIYSYNEIYGFAKDIKNSLINKFNLKRKNDETGNSFVDIDKKIIINYLCDDINVLCKPDEHKELIYELTKNETNLNSYCEKISYYTLIANDKYAEKTFMDVKRKALLSWRTTAQNRIVSKNKDTQYVKIKYNTIGVRFKNNYNGKLIVEGPTGYKNGGFKLIKKEEFHWTISKNMLE